MGFFKAKILGTGAYHPKKIVTNHDIAKTVDTSHEWIFERSGIEQRRISSTEGGEFTSDLALHASEIAIKNANIDKNDIDLIIMATYTPDFLLPNCASILQTKLGMTNGCGAVDLAAACSGFLYALNFANTIIQSGGMKKILVVGAEMLSQKIDWTDRSSCILFGDGAGAFVVGRNEDTQNESEILSWELGADGTGRDFLYQTYGGVVHPITEKSVNDPGRFLYMNGREMFKVAVRTLADISLKAIKKANLEGIESIDWFVPHQANLRILEATAKRLYIDENKVIINIDRYANTSAATIPTAFYEAVSLGKIKRGDTVLMAAFGAGLTSSATVFKY